MNPRTTAILIASVLTAAPVAAGDWWRESAAPSSVDQKVFDRDAHDAYRIQWIDEYVEVMAGATVDMKRAVNQAHAVSMAKKTARHLAYEKLAETITGIRITSDARFDRELMLDANLRTSVQSFIRGAKVVKEQVSDYPDGSVWAEVVLGVHLAGDRGVGGAVNRWVLDKEDPGALRTPELADAPSDSREEREGAEPESGAQAPSAKADPQEKPAETSVPKYKQSFTGLVVEARGLGARPGLVPRLVTAAGTEVYGPGVVAEEEAASRGLVAYATSMETASRLERVGRHPLVVRAVGTSGDGRSDLVITDDAASLIRATLADKRILKQCAVAFVLD